MALTTTIGPDFLVYEAGYTNPPALVVAGAGHFSPERADVSNRLPCRLQPLAKLALPDCPASSGCPMLAAGPAAGSAVGLRRTQSEPGFEL